MTLATESTGDREPAASAVHRVSAAGRALGWLHVLLALLLLAACVYAPIHLRFQFDVLYVSFAGALLSGAACIAAIRRARLLAIQVAAEENGLLVRLRGQVRHVRWKDVKSVRVRPLLRVLEMRVNGAAAPVRIPFELSSYEGLALVAAVRTMPKPVQGRDVFHCRRVDAATPVVAPLVIAASLLFYGTVLIIAWVVAVSALLYWLTGWLRIRITDNALVLERPVGRRRVEFRAIADVVLTTMNPMQSLRPSILVLDHVGGAAVIDGVREGEHALYSSLVAALESYRAAHDLEVPVHAGTEPQP